LGNWVVQVEYAKDAERKARRVPKGWGKVLFLTRD
jgi:hypothetical protein